ncbi:MAG: protein kinase, partial [archaeon]|nr:protein kinase [archaeon]
MVNVKADAGVWLLGDSTGVLTEDYALLDLLGEGAFAKVYRGRHLKTGEEVAIKVIEKANVGNEVGSLTAEVNILKSVQHPSIIRLKNLYETKDQLFIVTEIASGGELFNRILDKGAYTEKDAARLVAKILE